METQKYHNSKIDCLYFGMRVWYELKNKHFSLFFIVSRESQFVDNQKIKYKRLLVSCPRKMISN